MGMRKRRRGPSLACRTDSGTLRVSPKLARIYMDVLEIMGADAQVCAACCFHVILDLLRDGDIAINQPPVSLEWGRA
jgi:hypothetical protein